MFWQIISLDASKLNKINKRSLSKLIVVLVLIQNKHKAFIVLLNNSNKYLENIRLNNLFITQIKYKVLGNELKEQIYI